MLWKVDYGPGESVHQRYRSIPNEHHRDLQLASEPQQPTIARERNNRRGKEGNGNAGSMPAQAELTFVQQANAETPIEEIQCCNCQQMGHYANTSLPYWRPTTPVLCRR